MRKADHLRMFKTNGTKLTEIRVKIDLGRIADGVVVGFNIGDGGEGVDGCAVAFRHLLALTCIVLHGIDHRVPLLHAERVVDTAEALGHLRASCGFDSIER